MRFVFSFFVVFFLVFNLWGQSIESAEKSGSFNFRLTGKIAASEFLGEVQKDFSGGVNEFKNQMSLGGGIEFSNQFSSHWEVGVEVMLSVLQGEADNPDFSAIGYHASMKEPITEPVVYKNQLFSPKVYLQYNFTPLTNKDYVGFVRTGVGYLPYKAELRYKNRSTDNIIFGKGVDEYEQNRVSTAVYSLGAGIRFRVASHWELMAGANLNMTNYDFLDVVHNYNTAGERIQMRGFYMDGMIGLTYRFNSSEKEIKKHSSKKKKGKSDNYLPFYRKK